MLAVPASAAPQLFTEHNIESTFTTANSVYATDVDGDGDTDVVGASYSADAVSWWENDGASPPGWTQRRIAGGFDGPYSVYATDVDADGDVDVLGAAYEADTITWWENDGGSPPGWTERNIESNFDGASSVFAIDLDGDGDTDVLGTDMDGDHVAFWENDGEEPPGWTRHNIDDLFGGGYAVYAADLDGDGDVDVLAASVLGHLIDWWENEGGRPPSWTSHRMDGAFYAATSVYAADLDGDGDIDVLGAGGGDGIAWWENDGSRPPGWTKHYVDDDFSAESVYGTDVDGDGDVDVVGASTSRDDITWWENDGASPPAWTEHNVDDNFDGACSVYATDVDGDCDVDILGASWSGHGIMWWENVTTGFTMLCTSTSVRGLTAGGSASFEIGLTGYGGFPERVTLSAAGLPAGAVASFTPNPVTPTGESVMTVTTDVTTPGGTYVVEVIGTFDGACSRRTTVVLEVEAQEFVPEARTVLLLSSGLAGLAGYATLHWRRRSQSLNSNP